MLSTLPSRPFREYRHIRQGTVLIQGIRHPLYVLLVQSSRCWRSSERSCRSWPHATKTLIPVRRSCYSSLHGFGILCHLFQWCKTAVLGSHSKASENAHHPLLPWSVRAFSISYTGLNSHAALYATLGHLDLTCKFGRLLNASIMALDTYIIKVPFCFVSSQLAL